MTSSLEERVRTVTSSMVLPGKNRSLAATGAVEHLAIETGTVDVELDTSSMDSEQVTELSENLQRELTAIDGVDQVRVRHAGLCSSGEARIQLPSVDAVVLVASSKGGVGKTTIATALARRLSDHVDVGLFDADLQGPDAARALSARGPLRAGKDGRPEPVNADGVEVVSTGLIEASKPLAWRGSVLHDAVRDLLGDTRWGDLDVLVIDAPPGTGDVMLTLAQTVPIDGSLLVSTPHTDARSGIARTADVLVEEGIPVLGTVENMAKLQCPDCGSSHPLHSAEKGEEPDQLTPIASLPFDPSEDAWADHPAIARLSQVVRSEIGSKHSKDRLDLRDVPEPARSQITLEETNRLEPGEKLSISLRSIPAELVTKLERGGLHVTTKWIAPGVGRIEARRPARRLKKPPTDPGSA